MYGNWTPATDQLIILVVASLFFAWSAWKIRRDRRKGR